MANRNGDRIIQEFVSRLPPIPEPETTPLTTGELLGRAIRRSGMTQQRIAAMLGITRETISRHVNNKIPISAAMLKKYADTMGIPEHTLILPPKALRFFGRLDDSNIVNTEVIKTAVFTPSYKMPESWLLVTINSLDDSTIDGSWEFFDSHAIMNKQNPDVSFSSIEPEVFGKISYCMTGKGEILRGIITKPGRAFKFDIETLLGQKKIYKNISLLWASPVVNSILQPRHIGCQID